MKNQSLVRQRSLLAVSFSFLVCCFTSLVIADRPQPPQSFRAIFNGDDLDGWYGAKPDVRLSNREDTTADQDEFRAHWRVESGELINDGYGPFATSVDEYGDIELFVEYKTVAKADSGIYLRGAPQIQIWDFTETGGKWKSGAGKGSGGLFNNSNGAAGRDPLVLADLPFGQWNQFHIVQLGSRTTVHLNGRKVVDNAIMENLWGRKNGTPLPSKGPIHLQTHGGEIRWRNLYLREIPPEEANAMLRGNDALHGFTSLFNGHDLTGWRGAVANYEIRNGAIVCQEGKGGVLHTERRYGDFVARLEFQLPVAGNNGLAIRYPGDGDAAYAGMCELQVIDNTAERYNELDPRQYHGSAYGMVPAHRGYLRSVGQWNYQQVTVKGSTIKVEVNGTVILDADLATVSVFMANTPHPGKDVTDGFFGFAGHSDPVMFRNIAIRELW